MLCRSLRVWIVKCMFGFHRKLARTVCACMLIIMKLNQQTIAWVASMKSIFWTRLHLAHSAKCNHLFLDQDLDHLLIRISIFIMKSCYILGAQNKHEQKCWSGYLQIIKQNPAIFLCHCVPVRLRWFLGIGCSW